MNELDRHGGVSASTTAFSFRRVLGLCVDARTKNQASTLPMHLLMLVKSLAMCKSPTHARAGEEPLQNNEERHKHLLNPTREVLTIGAIVLSAPHLAAESNSVFFGGGKVWAVRALEIH